MPVRAIYSAIEDRYLVAASLAGRPEAYDELVRRYRGAVILLAWKMLGSREAAQDAAQEAFVIAFRRLEQLKDPRQFGPWLRVIAQNRAKYLGRRESRSRAIEGDRMDALLHGRSPDHVVNPLDVVLLKERDAAIQGLMATLPDGVQIVLQLYYVEQWSVMQIAEFLSLTRTTVKWRLHAGRKRLSRELMAVTSNDTFTDEAAAGPDGASSKQHPDESGDCDHEERKPGDQAHSAHPGRDRIACGR